MKTQHNEKKKKIPSFRKLLLLIVFIGCCLIQRLRGPRMHLIGKNREWIWKRQSFWLSVRTSLTVDTGNIGKENRRDWRRLKIVAYIWRNGKKRNRRNCRNFEMQMLRRRTKNSQETERVTSKGKILAFACLWEVPFYTLEKEMENNTEVRVSSL